MDDYIKYLIKVGSTFLDERYTIQSIIVDKRINKIPYAKVVIQDGSIQSRAFAIANDKTFAMGVAVSIEAGYGDKLASLFTGVVAKLAIQSRSTGDSTFIVTCRDVAYKTTITPHTMHFEKCTDSDLFKKIVGKYSGLKSNLEATQCVHECMVQHEISDWDFLNIRAEANGQIIVVNDGTISIKKPKTTGKGALSYTYGVDFIDFNAEIDSKDQWAGATVLTWDSSKQTATSEKASEPGEQSMGDLSYTKLTAATAQQSLAMTHGGVTNPVEIKTLATALLNRRRIAKIKGRVTVDGHSKLLHDHMITIEKGAAHFEGDAYVSGVHHIISAGKWQTVLTLGLEAKRYMRQYSDIGVLPAAGMIPPVYGLQIGIVKKITQDPKKDNRIFVHLPLIQDKPQEGIWCRLASYYATQQGGALFVPEIEDEVVIGFLNDDIRFPIILGALYSGKHTPPQVIDDKNTFKSFISREKLELTFCDDQEGAELLIKTAHGNRIQLSDKKKSIEIVDQNNNKIVLSADGIDFTSSKDITWNAQTNITIKSGKDILIQGNQNVNVKSMNINAEASMKTILSGNASTEVKSNMTTIVKGTTVLIN